MQKLLIVLGITLLVLVLGLAWPWLSTLPLGRLPGDIVVKRENFRFYLPVTTMFLIGAVLSALAWLLRS